MKIVYIAALLALLTIANTCGDVPPCIPTAVTQPGYCTYVWASGLSVPRGMVSIGDDVVLVVERGNASVRSFWLERGRTYNATIAAAVGLNHGIAITKKHLYASSNSTVFRWDYCAENPGKWLGPPEVVVQSIPDTYHFTRTLEIDPRNPDLIYVSVGSGDNVVPDALRSGVYRYDLTNVPPGGYTFQSGAPEQSFVHGLRNAVAMRFDGQGRLWTADNGVDNLYRQDLGGDIHSSNPGEDINVLSRGEFYGYPYCWSQYNLTGVSTPNLTMYSNQQYFPNITDGWCANQDNVKRPLYALQPHTAPLDLIFYQSSGFPGIAPGDMFVTQHGSWNVPHPAGYAVRHIEFEHGKPHKDVSFFRYNSSVNATTYPNTNWYRPVALAWTKNAAVGRALLVTSDTLGSIIAIYPSNNCKCPTESS